MSIRAIILALTVPLFLAIAAINGAVLYYQEQTELSRGLAEQARSAAVVVGEFVAEMEDPRAELAGPVRRQAIDNAVTRIEGLRALALVEHSGSVTPLASGAADWAPAVDWQNNEATEAHFDEDGGYFVAVVPAGEGRAVAARIDAAPLAANRARMGWVLAGIFAGLGLLATALGWFVAGRVVRELAWIGRHFAAGDESGEGRLSFRETRDLADAARLMRASQAAAEKRHALHSTRKTRERSTASAADALRRQAFGDVLVTRGAVEVAVRSCGEVPAGTFHAIVGDGEDMQVVLGQCSGESEEVALANAIAARRFIVSGMAAPGGERCLDLARRAFALDRLEVLGAGDGRAFACLARADQEEDARRIARSCGELEPERRLAAICAMLRPDGIFASVAVRK